MIAAEAPISSARSWWRRRSTGAAEALASDLLGETDTLRRFADPAGQPELGAGHPARGAPAPAAGHPASPGELSRDYLSQVRVLGTRLGVYKSMLYQPAESYTRSGPGPDRHGVGLLARQREIAGTALTAACPTTSRPRTRRSRSSPRPR